MKTINLTKNEIDFLINIKISSEFEFEQKKSILKKLNKKRIKTSSAKAKGRNLQKWVCGEIAELIGIEYDQQDDNCLIHSREMGQHGNDIILREEVFKKFPFSIECKNTEKFNIRESINQAIKNTKKDTSWMVIYKYNGLKIPVVIIDWNTFKEIWKRK